MANDLEDRNKSRMVSSVSKTFLRHHRFLKRFLSKFLQSEQDIEDVAQEAFLKAYDAEQDKGSIDQPKAFLFSIAKNLALNELARKSRQMTDYIEDCQAQLPGLIGNSVESEIQANASLGLYCEAVASLPERCRHVYLLRKVQGLSHKEIASRLGVSLSTVEKHIRVGSLSCRDYILRREQQGPARQQPFVRAIGETQNG